MSEHDDLFNSLYSEHSDSVWGFCRARCGNDADAEDCFQATWLAVHRSLGRYRQDGKARAWLLTIAHNAMVDHFRRRGAEQLGDRPLTAQEPNPVDQLSGDEAAQVMAQAIAGLSDKLREIWHLRQVEGASYREAAAITGEREQTLMARMHLAVKTLKEAWAGYQNGSEQIA
jgi:RNA polymerase sigma-70 factor (ECF subfamily)